MRNKPAILALCLVLALAAFNQVSIRAEAFDYKDADLRTEAAAEAVKVDLSGGSGTYTITEGGDYILSGSLNGQVLVRADKNDKVHLFFNNASINNPSGVAIYGMEADKITLTLMEGTHNFVTDGVNYPRDEDGADAAIYSRTDLSINGAGSLTATGNTAHGILSKDDLVIAGGQLFISAVTDGMRGKDLIAVREGSLAIRAGSDGMHANDDEEGNIIIDGGSFDITANHDGIKARGSLTVNEGRFAILTGNPAEMPAQGGRGERLGGWNEYSQSESRSAKGIKAGGSLAINGGNFALNTSDDGIHSNTEVLIQGGTFEIITGDDGIHADELLHIRGGSILITQSYEGIEAKVVVIDGGNLDITAADDAINAADSAVSTGSRGFGGRAQAGVSVTINGGIIKAIGGTDGIDSNGDIIVSGGEVDLSSASGGGRGSRALDPSGSYIHTGGTVTTNDGSDRQGNRQPWLP